jgi:hypothetical protein
METKSKLSKYKTTMSKIKEACAHQDYSWYEQKRQCLPRFMINKQDRKKSLKGKLPYKITRRKPNSQIHCQKKEKTHWEQRQSSTIDLQIQAPPQETTRIQRRTKYLHIKMIKRV